MQATRLSKNAAIRSLITPTAGAAGTSDINSSIIDMFGYNAVLLLARFGAITTAAVTSIKAQHGDDSGLSDAADIEGTAQTVAVADAGEIFAIDIVKPTKRYVRLVVDRGTANAVVASAEAILYAPQSAPASQPAGTNIEAFTSPASGTA